MQPMCPWDASSFERLRRAWGAFVTTREVSRELDPVVVRSWQRCAPRVNPEAPPAFQRVPSGSFPRRADALRLIEVARPEMEDVFEYIEGSHSVVALTDATLCLLELVGHPRAHRMAASLGLKRGVYCTEGSLGTNAFALAHRESMPVTVAGPEHYLKWLHRIFTAASPIYDGDGRILGVVGLMGDVEKGSAHLLGVVVGAARAIEASLTRQELFVQVSRREAMVEALLENVSEPVIIWDAGGQITHLNARAAEYLGVEQRAAVGRTMEERVELPPGAWERVRDGHVIGDVTVRVPARKAVGDQGGGGELRGRLMPLCFSPESEPAAFSLILQEARARLEVVRSPVDPEPAELAGPSPYAGRLRRIVEAAMRGRAPVVVEGELGLSREGVARTIHLGSDRRFGPWVSLNANGLAPEHLLPPMDGRRDGPGGLPPGGYLRMAEGGTLFLDEVEALSAPVQRLLIAILQRTSPVPGHAAAVDVRLMVGTTQPLRELERSGRLRKDLVLALDCFGVELRPLRERRTDLPAIMHKILAQHMASGLPRATLAPEAERLLQAYPWPGNATELSHVLEHAAALASEGIIEAYHLPSDLQGAIHRGLVDQGRVRSVEEAELEAILQAGWATGGRITQMAALLGISRTTVWRRLRDAGIDSSVFKSSKRHAFPSTRENVAR